MTKKKVSVVLEHRFFRVGSEVYTALSFPYSYWEEYLRYFDEINVVARVKTVPKVEQGFAKVTGKCVSVTDVKYYQGVNEFLIKFPVLLFNIFTIVKSNEKFILRSGNISNITFLFLVLFRKDYLREYPGNIKEGIIGFAGPSRRIRAIASISDWIARFQANYSKANSFVSSYCKSLYGSNKPSFVFSSFNSDEIQESKAKYISAVNGRISLVSVGRLEPEKGHYYLLRSMYILNQAGVDVELSIIGGGSEFDRLEKLSKDWCLSVSFLGVVTDRPRLFAAIAEKDVFVIPSLTEGMPRALLEAMTIGMPCIGTDVGGIPEVLEDEMMVPPGDANLLAGKISDFLDQELRERSGNRNKSFTVGNFSNDVLRDRRKKFWSMLYE